MPMPPSPSAQAEDPPGTDLAEAPMAMRIADLRRVRWATLKASTP
jgi:hypothetical protein